MLAEPATAIRLRRAKRTSLRGLALLDDRGQHEARKVLRASVSRHPGLEVEVEVVTAPPQHVGLGSKTALLLSLAAGVSALGGTAMSQAELIALTRRGGTSGIGVHGFFRGGFLVDGGHAQRDVAELLPSSARKVADSPLLVTRLAVPNDWRFHLVVPAGARHSDSRERAVFRKQTPFPESHARKAIAATYHGIVPAFAREDLALLSRSLDQIHRTGMKRAELSSQAATTRRFYSSARRALDCPVGMSSMGPLVYAISDRTDSRRVSSKLRDIATDLGGEFVATTRARNSRFGISRT